MERPPAPTAVASPPALEEAPRLRVCSLTGIAGSALILVGFFLPWVSVDATSAEGFRAGVTASPVAEAVPVRADWHRLAEEVARTGAVSGLDVFYWARTALATAATAPLPEEPGRRRAERAVRVAAVSLAAVPALALLLLLYFVLHHCRKARSPALILATLVGAAAITMAAVQGRLQGVVEGVAPAEGITVFLAGGGLLFLAGTFGVRLANWWRVFGGALALGALLVAGILGYVIG